MALSGNAPQARANVEIKVRCEDLAGARAAALRLGAEPAGDEEQSDTYFATRRGRLKLRETSAGRAELIPYLRPDLAGARRADYRVIPIADAAGTRELLSTILGVQCVVKKRREVLWWRDVRIHLDRVEGLGSFLELEALFDGSPQQEAAQRRVVEELMRALGIAEGACIAGSYETLLGRVSEGGGR
jgi:predicted adenylyl cyclase CyaB